MIEDIKIGIILALGLLGIIFALYLVFGYIDWIIGDPLNIVHHLIK